MGYEQIPGAITIDLADYAGLLTMDANSPRTLYCVTTNGTILLPTFAQMSQIHRSQIIIAVDTGLIVAVKKQEDLSDVVTLRGEPGERQVRWFVVSAKEIVIDTPEAAWGYAFDILGS